MCVLHKNLQLGINFTLYGNKLHLSNDIQTSNMCEGKVTML